MADPGDKKKRATYQDVLDAPEHQVAEIINGELRLSPRPAAPHTRGTCTINGPRSCSCRLHEGQLVSIAIYTGDQAVRAEPFDALELDLSRLWRDIPQPPRPRSSEPAGCWSFEQEYELL
jgi:hypothetical protein